VPGMVDERLSKKQQLIISFVFGVVFILLLLVVVFIHPNPSPVQYLVIRVVLALAAAGVAAILPGTISTEYPDWARAGGALAVFLIVFFVNPPEVLVAAL
jgi:MFS family permease